MNRDQAAAIALQQENDELAMQLAKSFEELSLLRRLAASLAVHECDAAEPFHELLDELREVVGAKELHLVEGDMTADDWGQSVCLSAGVGVTSGETVREMIRTWHEQADQRPYVFNGQCESNAGHAVESLVLIRMSSGPFEHGWMLALNHMDDMEDSIELGFSSVEATLLLSAASIIASFHRNLSLLNQREELFTDMVRALVNAVDARDPYTCGHSERVGLYAQRLAEEMGASAADSERLYLAGLLHDVGKIAVPDAVLRKCGRLSEVEFNAIAQHPVIGHRMLEPLAALQPVLPGVLHHHESVDGTGYPDGLAGDAIPADARILAICDAYDAMTSDRTYRRGMPHEKSLSILRDGAGSQWDTEMIEAFLDCADDIRRIGGEYTDRLNLTREVLVEQPFESTGDPVRYAMPVAQAAAIADPALRSEY